MGVGESDREIGHSDHIIARGFVWGLNDRCHDILSCTRPETYSDNIPTAPFQQHKLVWEF